MAKKTTRTPSRDNIRKKKLFKRTVANSITCMLLCIYFFTVMGAAIYHCNGQIIDGLLYLTQNIWKCLISLWPCSWAYPFIGFIIGVVIDLSFIEDYIRRKDTVDNPHGDAAFTEDYDAYNAAFVNDATIIKKATKHEVKGYYDDDDGHKFIVTEKIPKKLLEQCYQNSQIFAENVSMSINGKWCQRNANALIFGASGAGKTRFYLKPNILQANASYIVTDPSGDIMQGLGAFLRKEGYIVKCLNVDNMNKSCRFNPLYYIRDQKDIPTIAKCLMENTKDAKKSAGDPFWDQATLALLAAIFGYLFEVEPIEKRNFYNTLNFLLTAPQDENATETTATDFDKMFMKLKEKNPNSYAVQQYETFKTAPTKTALSVLISTTVMFSTYLVDDFNNLTYKDELDLDKIGTAPFVDINGNPMEKVIKDQYGNPMQEVATNINGVALRDENGNVIMQDRKIPYTLKEIEADPELNKILKRDDNGYPVEGEPYRVALFLCIPQGDTTYNWIVGMLYSVLFDKIYKAGSTRMADIGIGDPELAYPVRFLIDECANIGKIPYLSERLATCRKYKLSVVPIFQNYSQVKNIYKEEANSIVGNCDTMLFLGGADPDTLKIVTGHLGKETIQFLTNNFNKNGRSGSVGTNISLTGRDLMTAFQVEQMKNSECLVFIRSVKPFRDRKYPLQNHPNYQYTAEKNKKDYKFINPFILQYDDEEMESIRMKFVGEEGYIEPKEVESARSRAMKITRAKKRRETIELFGARIDNITNDSRKSPSIKSKELDRLKNELLKQADAIQEEAKSDGDTAFYDELVKFEQKYNYGIFVVEQTNQEENKEMKKEDVVETTETKTEIEHSKDIIRRDRARAIQDIQDGNMIPTTDIGAYKLATSNNPFAEFEASILSDEDKAMFAEFYKEDGNTTTDDEVKNIVDSIVKSTPTTELSNDEPDDFQFEFTPDEDIVSVEEPSTSSVKVLSFDDEPSFTPDENIDDMLSNLFSSKEVDSNEEPIITGSNDELPFDDEPAFTPGDSDLDDMLSSLFPSSDENSNDDEPVLDFTEDDVIIPTEEVKPSASEKTDIVDIPNKPEVSEKPKKIEETDEDGNEYFMPDFD